MLRSIRYGAVALLVALPAAGHAQAFEGRVTAQFGGSGGSRGPADVVIMVKGGKSRMETDMGGMQMAMIMDYGSGSMTTLMPAQRMYMKMDLKQAAEQMGAMTGNTATAEPPTVTRTGRRETIAGISCEHILFTTKDAKVTDVCAATGMGFFAGGGSMGGGRSAGIPAAFDKLMKDFKDGFFPLKIEGVDGDKRVQVMLVSKVERVAVDASIFEVPAGYSQMTMPGRP